MSVTKRKSTIQCFNVKKSDVRRDLPQILAVSVKNLLLYADALTLGFPTILIPSVSGRDPTEISMNPEEISWISPINLIACSIGCLMTGPITNAIGRKICMQLLTIPFFIGWMVMYFSTEKWHIYLALSINGFTGGLMQAPVITYVAEITEPHLRGVLSALTVITIHMGYLTQFLLGSFLTMRQAVLVNSVAPLISLISLFFIPESPIWLMVYNKPEEAKKSLAWLRGWTTKEKIGTEFEELWTNIRKENGENGPNKNTFFGYIMFLRKKENYVPFSLVAFAYIVSHFSGSGSITTFAVPLFTTLKSPINAYYTTIALGIMQILGTFLCMFTIRLTGRRWGSFISLLGMGICFLIVSVYIYVHNIFQLSYLDAIVGTTHLVPVIFLLLTSFSAYAGIMVLPWNLVGEIFPTVDRSKAAGMASAIGFLISSASRKLFPSLVNWITLPGVFLFYAIVAFSGIVILFFILPETEGKSLHEITEHFKGVTKLDNKVKHKLNKETIQEGNTNC